MIATYRLQLHAGFGFDDVRAVLPYLRDLGISHVYLSPITDARRGSMHGYDVVDHTRIREELGGEGAFARLADAVRGAGLRLVVDFVPNHGGVGARNARWQDVLAHGEGSPSAAFFDIDWRGARPELRGKVLLPYLGRPYGEALDAGEISIVEEDGRYFAAYYHNRFALTPETWPQARALLRSPGVAADPAALHALLERQYWRLAYWKTAASEINYRRFFDINELVALRQEDAAVFAATHTLLERLLREGAVWGVRVDHIDGLRDPHGYLRRLRALGAERIWVEKILGPDEVLPAGWPVEGTTGYEFMNDVLGLLTAADGRVRLDRLYRRAVPEAQPWADEAREAKREVAATLLSGELSLLTAGLLGLAEADYHTRDVTAASLREALAEVVAAFPRYRTYLPDDAAAAAEVIRGAVDAAQRRRPGNDPTSYDLIRRVLLGEVHPDLRAEAARWTQTFQQYTAPVAAKGVEDTAGYRFLRLVALNEVGGDPGSFGLTVERFHARNRLRGERHPHSLLATATHDHKRGEDTRMRMLVLAELVDDWRRTAARLGRIVRRHAGRSGPSRRERHLLAQTLVALWHGADRASLVDRVAAYLRKAAREAKLRTSWLAPDDAYETQLERVVRAVIADPRTDEALAPLAEQLARFGFVNTITQVILKATVPGVPDFYQGGELLDLSLVDPDNRRAVDFDRRGRLLDELEALLDRPEPGVLAAMAERGEERFKLYVTAALLRLRASTPAVRAGAYLPLRGTGLAGSHAVVYARTGEGAAVVVVVPRFPAALAAAGGWGEARIILPDELGRRAWEDVLSGETVAAARPLAPGRFALPWIVLRSVSAPPEGPGPTAGAA